MPPMLQTSVFDFRPEKCRTEDLRGVAFSIRLWEFYFFNSIYEQVGGMAWTTIQFNTVCKNQFGLPFFEVSILTIFCRSRSCFRPNFGRIAAQPKLNLRLSFIPTAAAAAINKNVLDIFGVIPKWCRPLGLRLRWG